MEVILGKTAGFCFGVANAVNKTKKILETNKVCCLGELVHNHEVSEELMKYGLEFIDKIEQATKPVIIRSHGEPISTYKIAEENGIETIDLTCPKVLKTHEIARKYSEKNYYIFLVGQITHPETIATKSYCGKQCTIVEYLEDVNNALENLNKSRIKKFINYVSNNI